jgi:nucleotide-binding universal stress UspA family protein
VSPRHRGAIPIIQSILVPVDLSEDADRALPVAAALARQMPVPLRSVTVTSPGIRPTADEAEVRQHARRAGVVLDGVRLSYDEDVTGGILAQRDADQALLCCATHARNRLVDALVGGSVSDDVSDRCPEPVVLVGPGVRAEPPFSHVTCLPPGGGRRPGRRRRHRGGRPGVGHGLGGGGARPRGDRRGARPRDPQRATAAFTEHDLDVGSELVHDEHPADAILGHADGLDRPLLVLPPRPSTDRLTTDVVRHAGCPVLAVPPLR